jgi:hypothetical protein
MLKLAYLVICAAGFLACGLASNPQPDIRATEDGGYTDASVVCVDLSVQCSIFGAPCKDIGDCCVGPIKAKCLANACSPDI